MQSTLKLVISTNLIDEIKVFHFNFFIQLRRLHVYFLCPIATLCLSLHQLFAYIVRRNSAVYLSQVVPYRPWARSRTSKLFTAFRSPGRSVLQSNRRHSHAFALVSPFVLPMCSLYLRSTLPWSRVRDWSGVWTLCYGSRFFWWLLCLTGLPISCTAPLFNLAACCSWILPCYRRLVRRLPRTVSLQRCIGQ